MIVSKGNLQVHEIAVLDKAIPALAWVCFTKEGISVAANGKSVLIVTATNAEIARQVPIDNTVVGGDLCIPFETCKEVLRGMPKDVLFKGLLEHVDISREGVFTLTDGIRKRTITAKVYEREWIKWRDIAKRAEAPGTRCVMNRKRFLKLLETIDAICQDSEEVYLQISSDVVSVRAMNQRTGQRALGIMNVYKGVEAWLDVEIAEPMKQGVKRVLCRKAKS